MAFGIAGQNVFEIRVAFHAMLDRASAFGWSFDSVRVRGWAGMMGAIVSEVSPTGAGDGRVGVDRTLTPLTAF